MRLGERFRDWRHRVYLGPLGRWRDGTGLGSAGTAGYHVSAVRRGPHPPIAKAGG